MLVQANLLQTAKPAGRDGSAAPANGTAAPAAVAQPSAPPPQKVDVPDAADVQRTVEDVQGVAEAAGSSLQFSIDKDSGKTVVKVVDANTSEVIRQIPSEELLDLARNMTKLEGMLLNQKA